MTTRLEGPLKREIDVDGAAYTVTISPEGFRIVQKGKRNGYEMAWTAFVSGDAALAQALNVSVSGPRPSSAATKHGADKA